MNKSHSLRVLILGTVFFLTIFGLGISIYHLWSKEQKPHTFYGTVLSQPRVLPAFSMQGTEGYPIDVKHLQGHWTFLFMGFSHCASICPLTMAELAKMTQLIEKTPNLPRPQVLMITLDPKRDGIERMRDYVHSFDPNFLGARGSEEEVKKLAHYLGIAYTQIHINADKNANKEYNIEHSGAIMLLNPKGELVAFFSPPHHADLLVDDYLHLLKLNK